jgi:hypothetical protein
MAMAAARKSAKGSTRSGTAPDGFTAEERAAMKERAGESAPIASSRSRKLSQKQSGHRGNDQHLLMRPVNSTT